VGGKHFNICAPGLGANSADQEPSTITDFNGFVGLAYLDGMVTQTNTKTHEVRRLPFLTSDMRFMQGVYVGEDGGVRHRTFGFI
jgi:hypothetical protein